MPWAPSMVALLCLEMNGPGHSQAQPCLASDKAWARPCVCFFLEPNPGAPACVSPYLEPNLGALADTGLGKGSIHNLDIGCQLCLDVLQCLQMHALMQC